MNQESRTSARRILIVEDEQEIRDNLKVFFEMEGFETATAGNGREALDLLHTLPAPSLILLDLSMPVMNGAEFLAEKAREKDFATIPVVVISAVANPSELNGVSFFVKKPFRLFEILKVVDRYCSPPPDSAEFIE